MIMAQKIATRESYGNALAALGEKYDFVVLDADLAAATKTGTFKKKFPERFFDCGIAEGNMMTVAAGIATTGKPVFASTFAMFAAGRAFEQVRNSIAYPHLNVKIGATHAGITVGEDGATHQCLEDLGVMRTIPGMVVLNPADDVEARAAVEWALNYVGPVYIRFGRLAVPVVFDEADYKFEFGKNLTVREGTDVTIMATGTMLYMAIEAAEKLAEEGISARVTNVHTIKPIDKEDIIAAAKTTGCIVTAEEHNILGGLGSAVAEVVCECFPVPVLRVGVEDQFGRSGKVPPLLEIYGLTPANIVAKAKAAVAMKK
jgi:transketolase